MDQIMLRFGKVGRRSNLSGLAGVRGAGREDRLLNAAYTKD